VTRGAAGRMASQFSNLLFLDHVLQFTDIMIIHHTGNWITQILLVHDAYDLRTENITDCSAELFSNAEVSQALIGRVPDASNIVQGLGLPGYDE
jgi:carbonic anhydrase